MLKLNVITHSQPEAFLADAPAKPAIVKTNTQVSERTRAADIRMLYQLASDYDSISPTLATQLREIAARH